MDIAIRRELYKFWIQLLQLLKRMQPAKLAGLGYLSYTMFGWALLCLPFTQKVAVSSLDHLFIAASAMSTTGLVTVSVTDSYNWFGQLIVLMLIQFGGIGYMTFGSFVILSTKGELTGIRKEVGKTVFSLPESFSLEQFIRGVIVFTIVIEVIGALLLWPLFVQAGRPYPLWSAIFHSVSSFCTAGFGLYNNSFEDFNDAFWMNAILAALSYAGAIGFIVWMDCWRVFTRKAKQITLTSKIILWSSLWLSIAGTLLIFINEPSLKGKPADMALLQSSFQAMSAMTTVGFNTIPIGALSHGTILVLILLMIIGASPSGTGGGLKCTTFTAWIGVMRSILRGEEDVKFWNKPIPEGRIRIAIVSLGFYLSSLLIGTYLLALTDKFSVEEILFEAASALGTVGLSMGITGNLTHLGKLVIIFLMFCGRLGPLTFGMALFFKDPKGNAASDSDLAV